MMEEGKSETASSYSGWQLLKDMMEASRAHAAQIVPEAKECDHQGCYKVTRVACYAVRSCKQCGMSWRMYAVATYPGEYPAEWEPIHDVL